jgi:hypothetical protein
MAAVVVVAEVLLFMALQELLIQVAVVVVETTLAMRILVEMVVLEL